MKIENPVGLTGLVLSFLVACTGLLAIVTDLSAEVIGGINLVLAAGLALVAEIVRRIPKLSALAD